MSEKYYRIADLLVATNTDEYLSENFESFQCELAEGQSADMTIRFDKDPHKMYCLMQETVNEKLIIATEYICIYETDDHYTLVTYNDKKYVDAYLYRNRLEAVIFVDDSEIPRGAIPPTNVLGLTENDLYNDAFREAYMFFAQQKGRLAIHSSSIQYREYGWIFSGKSGSGKTTHIRQWKEAGIPIDVIDGDIAIIFRKDGVFQVAGLPWCGTSEEYSTICKPLGGIFFLKKDKQNYVGELSFVNQVLLVNAETLTPNWKREMMSGTLDLVEEICHETYVKELYCTPEPEAAVIMKEHIDNILDKVIK